MAVWARSSAVSGLRVPTNLMGSLEEVLLVLVDSSAPALAPVVFAYRGAPAAHALAFAGSGAGAGVVPRPGGATHLTALRNLQHCRCVNEGPSSQRRYSACCSGGSRSQV